MGFYNDVLLPHCIDVCCGIKALIKDRKLATSGLTGRVLEIGFGSGLNVPYYPEAVTEVCAVDPAESAFRIAERRVREARCPIRMVPLEADAIALADGWADSALSTFTLCTIADVQRALLEVRRVLKPGGSFHFLEHGRAPDPNVMRWQNRLNGLQRAVGGGCNLNREIDVLVKAAGFRVVSLDAAYHRHMARTHGYLYRGVAVWDGT